MREFWSRLQSLGGVSLWHSDVKSSGSAQDPQTHDDGAGPASHRASRPPRRFHRQAGVVGLLVVALLGSVGLTGAFGASGGLVPIVDIGLVQDGGAKLDSTAGAGFDTSLTNGIVRVNDTITYQASYSLKNVDSANPGGQPTSGTLVIPMPQGTQFPLKSDGTPNVPAGCSASPASVGYTGTNVTDSTFSSLQSQTLTCVITDPSKLTVNSSFSFQFSTQLLNAMGNNTPIKFTNPATYTVTDPSNNTTYTGTDPDPTASTIPGLARTSTTVTASARLAYDLSANHANAENTSTLCGDLETSINNAKYFAANYLFGLSAPVGGIGVGPVVGNWSFTWDNTTQGLYPWLPATGTKSIATINASPNKYAALLAPSAGNGGCSPGMMSANWNIGSRSLTVAGSSVADGSNTPVTTSPTVVTVSGTDTSFQNVPDKDFQGNALPNPSRAYVADVGVRMAIPLAAITDIGNASGGSYTLQRLIRVTSLSLTGLKDYSTGTAPTEDISNQPYNSSNDALSQTGGSAPAQPASPAVGNPAFIGKQTANGTWNDYYTTSSQITLQGSFNKYFMGVAGNPNNQSNSAYSPSYPVPTGLPGNCTRRSGSCLGVSGQQVVSAHDLTVNGVSNNPYTYLGCDTWDNTKTNLSQVSDAPTADQSNTGVGGTIASGGATVWVSGSSEGKNASGGHVAWTRPPNTSYLNYVLQVQYASVPASMIGNGDNSSCGNTVNGTAVTWYDTPSAVDQAMGVADQTDPATGKAYYPAVNKVRYSLLIPSALDASGQPDPNFIPSQGVNIYTTISIGMRITNNPGSLGVVIPNYAADSIWYNKSATTIAAALALGSPSSSGTSSYVPGSTVGDSFSGNLGDRLIVGGGSLAVGKQVKAGDGSYSPTDSGFGTTPPSVNGNHEVDFKLTPVFSSPLPATLGYDVWVEDCLPINDNYVGASITPSKVVNPANNSTAPVIPSDTHLASSFVSANCGAGTTYLRWVLPSVKPSTAITPILVATKVSGLTTTGSYTNNVSVYSDGDPSTSSVKQASASYVATAINGLSVVKTVLTPLVEVNSTGQTTNQAMKWNIELDNDSGSALAVDSTTGASADMVDILPTVSGLNSSTFKGTAALAGPVTVNSSSASGVAPDPGVQVLYTARATASLSDDPADASNSLTSTSAATIWCSLGSDGKTFTKVSKGSGSCPSAVSAVTGVRLRETTSLPDGGKILGQVSMYGIGNTAGNVYDNKLWGRGNGQNTLLGPSEAVAKTVSSSIGDKTWFDLDRDGLQGSSEPVAPGVPVTLSGTDDLGNKVSVTAYSDAKGAYSVPDLRLPSAAGYTVSFGGPGYVDSSGKLVNGSTAAGLLTKPTVGSDRTTDSDPAQGTGVVSGVLKSAAVADAGAMNTGAADTSIDAGYLPVYVEKLAVNSQNLLGPLGGSSWIVSDAAPTAGHPAVQDPLVRLQAITGSSSGPGLVAGTDPASGFLLTGLTPGLTYWLTESKAPTGFQLLAQPIGFKAGTDGSLSLVSGSDVTGVAPDLVISTQTGTAAASGNTSATGVPSNGPTLSVRDVPGVRLPLTGSGLASGTGWVMLGLGLGLTGLLLLGLARARRSGLLARARHRAVVL